MTSDLDAEPRDTVEAETRDAAAGSPLSSRIEGSPAAPILLGPRIRRRLFAVTAAAVTVVAALGVLASRGDEPGRVTTDVKSPSTTPEPRTTPSLATTTSTPTDSDRATDEAGASPDVTTPVTTIQPSDEVLFDAAQICDGGCQLVRRWDEVTTGAGTSTVAVVRAGGTQLVPLAVVIAPWSGAPARSVVAGQTWASSPLTALGLDTAGSVIVTVYNGGAHCCESAYAFSTASGTPVAVQPSPIGGARGGAYANADIDDLDGDGMLDAQLHTNSCLPACAAGPIGTGTWMATTDGYELAACRWTRIAESGDVSYDVAPAGGGCPAVDMARLCAPGAYDPAAGCVES